MHGVMTSWSEHTSAEQPLMMHEPPVRACDELSKMHPTNATDVTTVTRSCIADIVCLHMVDIADLHDIDQSRQHRKIAAQCGASGPGARAGMREILSHAVTSASQQTAAAVAIHWRLR